MKLWDKVKVTSTQEVGTVVEILPAGWPLPANDDRIRVRVGNKFHTFWADELEKAPTNAVTHKSPPAKKILIPTGEYNGVDLPGIWIDENYIVWIEVENPECNCEVIYGS